MTEFGLFNDEGCVESQLWSREQAEREMAERYTDEDELHVSEICAEHEGNEAHNCEECWAEGDEDEDEDDEVDAA